MVSQEVLQWKPLCEKYAVVHPILSWEEIAAIITNESSGNPNATNPSDPSWGLMGVTMLIGRQFAGVAVYQDLLIPDTNVMAGSGFLALLKTKYSARYPNWVSAYNQGEPNLLKGYLDASYVTAFNSHLQALNELQGEDI